MGWWRLYWHLPKLIGISPVPLANEIGRHQSRNVPSVRNNDAELRDGDLVKLDIEGESSAASIPFALGR